MKKNIQGIKEVGGSIGDSLAVASLVALIVCSILSIIIWTWWSASTGISLWDLICLAFNFEGISIDFNVTIPPPQF